MPSVHVIMRRGIAISITITGLALCSCSPSQSEPPIQGGPTNITGGGQKLGPFAVLVTHGGVGFPYTIRLIAIDGHVAAMATAQARSGIDYVLAPPCGYGESDEGCDLYTASPVPLVNVSTSRVYYLNGESELWSLDPNGRTSMVSQLPGGRNAVVGFAVSPDDRRIAVSLIEYTTSFEKPMRVSLSVSDLPGGGHHVDLRGTSGSTAEWPVGWRGENLVLATALGYGSIDVEPTSVRYRVVDASNGTTIASLDCAASLPATAGVACNDDKVSPPHLGLQNWDGEKRWFALAGASDPAFKLKVDTAGSVAVSPDGTRIAAGVYSGENLPNVNVVPLMLFSDAGAKTTRLAGLPVVWLDSSHLVLDAGQDGLRMADVISGSLASVPFEGTVVGVLPSRF